MKSYGRGLIVFLTVLIIGLSAASLNALALDGDFISRAESAAAFDTSSAVRKSIVLGEGEAVAADGFEDNYAHDGKVLVEAANQLVEYFAQNPDLLRNYRLVIVPCANPDGTIDGNNNKRACSTAFGRCTANHVDMNRDFISGKFEAQESRYLKSLMQDYSMDIFIDFHGWLNSVLGNGELVNIFRSTNGLSRDQTGSYGTDQGYIMGWARANLGAKSALVEFKSPSSLNYQNVANGIVKAVSSVGLDKPSGIDYQYSSGIPKTNNVEMYSKNDNSVTLTWNAVSGVSAYQIQVYKDGEWTHALNVFGATHATVSGLNSGTEYYFRVRGFKYSGNVRTYSLNWSTAVNICTNPHKVYGLQTAARSGDASEIKITWTPQLDADGYRIFRKINNKWVLADSVKGGASNSYTFTGLTAGWEYYFKVTAYRIDAGNSSVGSDELHTCAACPPMDLPGAAVIDSKTIHVDWNITNAHGYVVQWSTDPSFKTNVNSAYVVGHTSDSYTIKVANNAQNYYVRTRAWRYWENNSLVYGIWTDGVKAEACPVKVTGLYTSARGGYGEQLKISWDAQSSADSYNVYRIIDGEYTIVAETADTSYVFTDLVPGWEYYFKVSAVMNGKEGMLSNELHTCAACPPIETYSAEINNNGSVTVDWEKVNAHGYVVMWSTDPNFESDVNYSYVVGHESTSYTFTPNGNAENYYVRVRAWRYWENNSLVYGIWTDGLALK